MYISYIAPAGQTARQNGLKIYIRKQDIRISYMSPIDGQTAGPNGLKFFVDTHEFPGGVYC